MNFFILFQITVFLAFNGMANAAYTPSKLKCDAGDLEACISLSDIYYDGDGVSQNYEESARLYQKACDGGNPAGCSKLGDLYENGLAVEQDYEFAAQLYQKACDSGNARGCANLAVLYQLSRGGLIVLKKLRHYILWLVMGAMHEGVQILELYTRMAGA